MLSKLDSGEKGRGKLGTYLYAFNTETIFKDGFIGLNWLR